ncbi:MAG: hypothetical protein ACR2K1_15900, partial [Saprospiraceae bacterium]
FYLYRTANILFFLLGLCAIQSGLCGQCYRTGNPAGTAALPAQATRDCTQSEQEKQDICRSV